MSITTIANPEEIKKVTFPGQDPDEQILLIKRRHPIILFGFFCSAIVLLLIPLVLYFSLPAVLDPQTAIIIQKLFLFITGLYLLYICVIAFFIAIDYCLDAWIITNQRIIAIEQKGLFRRTITELRYSRIQDITSDVSGLVATFFQFGNIMIQTAAEQERMILRQITHPIETRRIIAETYRKATENTEEKKSIL